MNNFIVAVVFLILFSACGHAGKKGEVVHKSPPPLNEIPDVSHCMEKVLYYDLSVNQEDYDSISTQYFHEIKDYTDTTGRRIFDQLTDLRTGNMRTDGKTTLVEQDIADRERKIDSLTIELSKYEAVVTGYVFVHTFSNGKDTSTMIFVMDTDCMTADAIPVSTISDLNPDDYSATIRTIHPQ